MPKKQNHSAKPMKLSQLLRSTKPGTSLLVGLGLTTIIVLVSIGVTTVVISSIRESANVTGANQAYYAAEGALEKGLLVNQDKSAGFSDSDEVFTKPPKASYTIGGQVSVDTKYVSNEYGVPAPGTGKAGKDCDSLHPVISDFFTYSASTGKYTYGSSGEDPQDHPCNWGKLKVGETVTIPLYYTNSTGDPINVFSGSASQFHINLRAGCTDGQEFCNIRPQLDTTKGANSYKYGSTYDDPIATWQIIGQSPDGSKTYILSPYISFDPSTGWDTASTILYKSKINTAPSTGILTQSNGGIDSTGCRGSIQKFLTGMGSGMACSSVWATQNITKPVLKISLIHSIEDSLGEKIPHIEYQLLTNTAMSTPPTDTSQTITGEGYSGTFKQVLEVKNPQGTGLLEYVIQQ